MYQAVTVRIRWLPRMQQLSVRRYPLMTDRYLNLLGFAGESSPDQARAFCAGLKRGTGLDIHEVLAESARLAAAQPRRRVVAVSIAASAALLGAAGYGLFSPAAQRLAAELHGGPGAPPAVARPRRRPPRPALSARARPAHVSLRLLPLLSGPSCGAREAAAALEAHVPPAFAASCASSAPPAVTTTSGRGDHMRSQRQRRARQRRVLQYATAADMNAAFGVRGTIHGRQLQ